jgi:hypothetical protein
MLMDIAIGGYVMAMLCILPYYMPEGYTRLGNNKASFFETWSIFFWRGMGILLAIYLVFRIYGMIRDRSAEPVKQFLRSISVSEWLLAGYVVVMLVSTLVSEFPDTAWKGTNGWYMGFLPQLLAVGAYFAVNRISSDAFRWVLLGIPASAGIFFVGYWNRFDLLKVAESSDTLRISFIGNINWYCGYLVLWLGFGIGLYLILRTRRNRFTVIGSVGMALYLVICFATLLTQQSASGLLALAAGMLVLIWMIGKDLAGVRLVCELLVLLIFGAEITRLLVWRGFDLNMTDPLIELLTGKPVLPLLLVSILIPYILSRYLMGNETVDRNFRIITRVIPLVAVGAVVIWFVLALYNTSTGVLTEKLGLEEDNFLVFNAMWGSMRGATWYTAVGIFREQNLLHKLFGVGGDCFYEAYMVKGGELANYVDTIFPGRRLTNAHCEYLNILVNYGILGVVTFGGFIFTGIRRMLKSDGDTVASKVAFAAGLMLVFYTANNIPSFQQTTQMITMFLLAGIGERALRGVLIEKD